MKKNLVIAALLFVTYANARQSMRATEGFHKMSKIAMYYATKLDDHGIELTEFDRIAVNSMTD